MFVNDFQIVLPLRLYQYFLFVLQLLPTVIQRGDLKSTNVVSNICFLFRKKILSNFDYLIHWDFKSTEGLWDSTVMISAPATFSFWLMHLGMQWRMHGPFHPVGEPSMKLVCCIHLRESTRERKTSFFVTALCCFAFQNNQACQTFIQFFLCGKCYSVYFMSINSILTITLQDRCSDCYLHGTDMETEAHEADKECTWWGQK